MNQIGRIGYIDVMKGIAIICVLAGHYLSFPVITIAIYSFHMPLFVFLNGYFFKEGSIVNRIKKSMSAYMKPYFIVWIFILIFESLIMYYKGDNVLFVAKQRFISGFWALASDRALFRPEGVVKIGVIWFLNALFIGSVLQAITLKIRSSFYQICLVVMIFVVAMIQTAYICLPFGFNYGAAFLVWLMIGYYYHKNANLSIISFIEQKGFLYSLVIWISIIILEGLTGNEYNICWLRLPLYGVELIGAFSGIIVIMYISKYINTHTKILALILRYLGLSSLWILCIHAIDVELFVKVQNHLTIGINFMRLFFDIIFALLIRFFYKFLTISKTAI